MGIADKLVNKYIDKFKQNVPSADRDATNSKWKEKFAGTEYESLYNSIIDSYDSNTPVPTFWGAITGQNWTNLYHHNQEKNNSLLALAEKMYNENYESPSADVKRQRDAGLNPDLLGLSGQSADEMNPKASNPNIKAQSPIEVIEKVGDTLQFAFTTALSAWQSISSQGLNLAKSQLEVDDKTFDLSRKIFRHAVPHHLDSGDAVKISASRVFSNAFGNKRFRKNYAKNVDYLIGKFDSSDINWFDLSDSSEARNRFIKSRADYYKVPYNQYTTSKEMFDTFSTIRALAIKTEEMKMKFLHNESKYNSDKFSSMDGNVTGRSLREQDAFNANLFYFRNNNIEHYTMSDVAETNAKRAMASYQHFYHNCMLNLLKSCGYIGFTAWSAFAKSDPIKAYFTDMFTPPTDKGTFGFYY